MTSYYCARNVIKSVICMIRIFVKLWLKSAMLLFLRKVLIWKHSKSHSWSKNWEFESFLFLFNQFFCLFREIKSCARALYYHQDKIPEDRRSHLLNRLKELCPDEDVMAEEFLKSYIDIDIRSDKKRNIILNYGEWYAQRKKAMKPIVTPWALILFPQSISNVVNYN